MCQSRRPHTPAVRQPHAPFPAAAAVQVALQQLQPEARAGVHGFVAICALLWQSGGPRSPARERARADKPCPPRSKAACSGLRQCRAVTTERSNAPERRQRPACCAPVHCWPARRVYICRPAPAAPHTSAQHSPVYTECLAAWHRRCKLVPSPVRFRARPPARPQPFKLANHPRWVSIGWCVAAIAGSTSALAGAGWAAAPCGQRAAWGTAGQPLCACCGVQPPSWLHTCCRSQFQEPEAAVGPGDTS